MVSLSRERASQAWRILGRYFVLCEEMVLKGCDEGSDGLCFRKSLWLSCGRNKRDNRQTDVRANPGQVQEKEESDRCLWGPSQRGQWETLGVPGFATLEA